MSKNYLFTSESVACGHPDKMADQISDGILDACLREDPHSRVACETLVCPGLIFVSGEITTQATFEYQEIVRQIIRDIGYTDPSFGFDYRSCGIIISVHKQSADIALGVDSQAENGKELGAGDQGLMFGYACNDTPELMPLPIMLAHKIVLELFQQRQHGKIAYLGPDAKSQVTIEYSPDHTPVRVHTVVLSTQHKQEVDQEKIHTDMKKLITQIVPEGMIDEKTLFYINPTGRFVLGGPAADSGLTGRKIIVDTYGGMGRHGGGAFSGKDPTKVDRSAGYAARYVAKNIVAAKLATRCEIQLAYAIGVSHPISIRINTFGTGTLPDGEIEDLVEQVFDLSPGGIIDMLQLRRPIYLKTAFGGHFGRELPDFTWEKTDPVKQLHNLSQQKSSATAKG